MSTMTITCPACGLSKEVPTEKLPQKEVKLICPKCKNVFVFELSMGTDEFVIQPVADEVV